MNSIFHLEEVASQELWNEAVVNFTDDSFHQSWEWGETNKNRGQDVWHLGVFNETSALVGVCLVIKTRARRGSFLLVPHGPLFAPVVMQDEVELSSALKAITQYLAGLAKKEACVFVRVAPTLPRTTSHARVFSQLGYRQAPIFVQSELSWRLNLTPSMEELLANMRKSTRYILKRESIYGVSFERSNNPDDFERFYRLYSATVKNQEYVGHSKDFIEQEFRCFTASGGAQFYFASTGSAGNKKDLAGALIITQGRSGFYHYGGSVKDANNTPAPHLLQWYIVRDLKERGFVFYNFWGISEESKPNHPWRGLTIFKKGFGGEELAYLKTQDFILSPLYWFTWVVETARRIKRNY